MQASQVSLNNNNRIQELDPGESVRQQASQQLVSILNGNGVNVAANASKVDPAQQLIKAADDIRQGAMIAFQNQGHIFETC